LSGFNPSFIKPISKIILIAAYVILNIMKKSNDNLISLCGKDFSREEIITLIKSDDIWEKQIAVLSMDEILPEFAPLLMENLTGVDGKVRDVVSLKISNLAKNEAQLFKTLQYQEIFLNSVCDVNPNVCRNIIKILPLVAMEEVFEKLLLNKIKDIINEIKAFKGENHKLNKKVFNLYWCLEALCEIIKDENINEILDFCSLYSDYTIREKTAKILKKMKNPPVNLKEKLSKDSNFYVRRIFYDNI